MNNQMLRLLVVDANQAATEHIKQLLDTSQLDIIAHCVVLLCEALECLKTSDIDLVLLELDLPDSVGIETFLQVYEYDVPIVIMTERDNESMAVTALRHGAQDFLVKNGVLNSRGLKRVIVHVIERCAFIKNNNAKLFCNDAFNEARRMLRESTKSLQKTTNDFGALHDAEKKVYQHHTTG